MSCHSQESDSEHCLWRRDVTDCVPDPQFLSKTNKSTFLLYLRTSHTTRHHVCCAAKPLLRVLQAWPTVMRANIGWGRLEDCATTSLLHLRWVHSSAGNYKHCTTSTFTVHYSWSYPAVCRLDTSSTSKYGDWFTTSLSTLHVECKDDGNSLDEDQIY